MKNTVHKTLEQICSPYESRIFGSRVLVFDEGMDQQEIQATVDAIHLQQKNDEFSSQRFALLFMPGSYELDITVDYYVQAMGLGRVPDDVQIRGGIQSIATTRDNNVTLMFWRSAENFSIFPRDPEQLLTWAVSQAAPLRRIHHHGDMVFDQNGWASGGFLANSVIHGKAGTRTGQQWFTMNSRIGGWYGGQWNRSFLGVEGAPAETWPEEPVTVIDRCRRFRDKPFLIAGDNGEPEIFVPRLVRNQRGVTWQDGPETGRRITMDECYAANPERDDAEGMNRALAEGKHLILTPGIYELSEPLRVERPDSLVFGLGFATLVPVTGKPALELADEDGIIISGLIIDAGPLESPELVRVGREKSSLRHSDNPSSLHDVFCRIGGHRPGRADVCMAVYSNDVLLDHLWLWRADHGAAAEWEGNTCRKGLVVYGDKVSAFGLFNEHFQEYQTLWYGERGETFFYQSELPYDPPSQDRWQADGRDGYASYKVADSVKEHAAYGLGIYAFLGIKENTDKNVHLENAVETPGGPGIHISHITTFSKGYGDIRHSLNGEGPAAKPGFHQLY